MKDEDIQKIEELIKSKCRTNHEILDTYCKLIAHTCLQNSVYYKSDDVDMRESTFHVHKTLGDTSRQILNRFFEEMRDDPKLSKLYSNAKKAIENADML